MNSAVTDYLNAHPALTRDASRAGKFSGTQWRGTYVTVTQLDDNAYRIVHHSQTQLIFWEAQLSNPPLAVFASVIEPALNNEN